MPRKRTGKPPGRPKVVRGADGSIDPSRFKPGPKAKIWLASERFFFKTQGGKKAKGHWPVAAKPSEIANATGLTVRYVQKLRNSTWGQAHFVSTSVGARLKNREREELRARLSRRIVDSPDGKKLLDWARDTWPKKGCVKSMKNGRCYHTPETYLRHMRANGLVPNNWVPTK